MKIKSLITDEHVTEGVVYSVAGCLEDDVIVWDNFDEQWDLFFGEYEVVEE